jgi:hypothetical protein
MNGLDWLDLTWRRGILVPHDCTLLEWFESAAERSTTLDGRDEPAGSTSLLRHVAGIALLEPTCWRAPNVPMPGSCLLSRSLQSADGGADEPGSAPWM